MSFQLKIFKWSISLIMLIPLSVLAQQSQDSLLDMRLKKSETIEPAERTKKAVAFQERDLKFGWDLSNLLIGAISPKRTGLDFSVDYTLKENLYGIGEFGQNYYEEASSMLNYISKGKYFRVGIDYDLRKDNKDLSRDMFYIGARYGFSVFDQTLENYQITSGYWPSVLEENIQFANQAHWIEAMSGFKVEILKNIYLGLGFRVKLLLFQTGDPNAKPAPFIPGYGKNSGTLVVGFNYNVYYNLPMNYTKKSSNRAK